MTDGDLGESAVGAVGRRGKPRKPGRPKKQASLARELPILVIVAIGLAFLIKTLFVQAFFIPSASMEKTLIGSQCDTNTSLRCTGDRVLVNKLIFDFRDPHRGEIVVFSGKDSRFGLLPNEGAPASSNPVVRGIRRAQSFVGLGANPNENDFIKRVIAVGGDTISCPAIPGNPTFCANVVVNGRPIDESSYLFENNSQGGAFSTSEGADRGDQAVFAQQTVPKGQLWVMGDHRDDSSDSRPNGTIPVSAVIGRAFVKVWPPSRIGGIGVPHVFQAAAAGAGAPPVAAGLLLVPVAGLRRRRRRS